jgi:hypothetical protein
VRVVLEAVFGDVGDVHDRLGGQQVEALDDRFSSALMFFIRLRAGLPR